MRPLSWSTKPHFYPRSPRGERPASGLHRPDFVEFLSTLPARGATTCWTTSTRHSIISIHAPREGSDSPGRPAHGPPGDFYPRSPRGERRDQHMIAARKQYFYPRSPRGERRTDGQYYAITAEFLSTLPARGATIWRTQVERRLNISIHAPREGSDLLAVSCSALWGISIHAPREGSDPTPPPAR